MEQIKSWRDAYMNANGSIAKKATQLNREQREAKKLEKELQRKEKALAEANVLLKLSTKADAI